MKTKEKMSSYYQETILFFKESLFSNNKNVTQTNVFNQHSFLKKTILFSVINLIATLPFILLIILVNFHLLIILVPFCFGAFLLYNSCFFSLLKLIEMLNFRIMNSKNLNQHHNQTTMIEANFFDQSEENKNKTIHIFVKSGAYSHLPTVISVGILVFFTLYFTHHDHFLSSLISMLIFDIILLFLATLSSTISIFSIIKVVNILKHKGKNIDKI